MNPALPDHVSLLAAQSSSDWPSIFTARRATREALDRLSPLSGFDTPTTSIVLFGSLGRGDFTEGSDVDWALLVDGPADPEHFRHAVAIGRKIDELGFRSPGPTGTFGELVSSHAVVHYIAGTRDTNENLTRRILLLAESRAATNPLLRETVIRNVLSRYVVHDRVVPSRRPLTIVIPFFLLNDVVRYWRTMTADYASKMWERQHQGWAVRNVKLRFSRKLLFVWGLLACFMFQLFPPPDREEMAAGDPDVFARYLAEFILEQTRLAPLDLLARVAAAKASPATIQEVFGAYDLFLRVLSDPDARAHLSRLPFDAAEDDRQFQELRDASHRFGEGILKLFYEDDPSGLGALTRRYGLF